MAGFEAVVPSSCRPYPRPQRLLQMAWPGTSTMLLPKRDVLSIDYFVTDNHSGSGGECRDMKVKS